MTDSTPSHLEPRLVERPEQLESLAADMQAATHIGIDSESNSMHAYRERVCLIQLALDDELYVVDPITLDDADAIARAFGPVLEDVDRTVVLHGGEYDVAVFKREYGIAMRGLFDTQQAASMLGWERTGLGALVERVHGTKLGKAYAKHDWGRRPLERAPLRYALDDVRYLADLHAHLSDAVAEADIEEEVAIANAAVEAAAEHAQVFDPAGFWKQKGVKELDAEARLRLQALWAWREQVASELDRPPGRLLNGQQMVALARRPPRSSAELRKARLPGRLRGRFGAGLLEAIRSADEGEVELLPRPAARRRAPEDRKVADRERKLKAWRRSEAEARNLALAVVLPSRALSWLAEHPDADWAEAPQLGPKRLRVYGDRLRELLS